MASSLAPNTVVVRVPAKLTLDQSNKILANTLGKLGCSNCYSGFDIRFLHIRDFVVNPKSFDVQEYGAQFG